MNEQKLANVISIMDLVGGLLLELLKVVMERKGNLLEIQAGGGDIPEEAWLQADEDFEAAYDRFMEEVEKV